MSSKKMYRNYQLLELEKDASPKQIEASYHRLLRLYTPGGLASYGLLRVSERGRLLTSIKQAYQQLMRFSSTPPDEQVSKSVSPLSGAPDDLALLHQYLQSYSETEPHAVRDPMGVSEHKHTPPVHDLDESLPVS